MAAVACDHAPKRINHSKVFQRTYTLSRELPESACLAAREVRPNRSGRRRDERVELTFNAPIQFPHLFESLSVLWPAHEYQAEQLHRTHLNGRHLLSQLAPPRGARHGPLQVHQAGALWASGRRSSPRRLRRRLSSAGGILFGSGGKATPRGLPCQAIEPSRTMC